MTLIPLALSIGAVWLLWGSGHIALKWVIVGVTVFAWLTNQAVRNSYRMEETGQSTTRITNFWTVASMVMFVVNCAVAVAGIVVALK